MRYLLLFAALITMSGSGAQPEKNAPAVDSGAAVVLQIRLDNEAITPVTARFIQAAILEAEQSRSACLVVVLDTPGGLVDSTREVAKAVLRARVPVVVYIPPGGRAASAGLFITLASHVAAMGPGSNIGAAHPVQIGGLPISPQPSPGPEREATEPGEERKAENEERKTSPPRRESPSGPLEQKVVNDTMAWARSLAELRGRNAEWAARAVKESVSASADEAVREQVVDLVAQDVRDLLEQIDGREVKLAEKTVRLQTAGAVIRNYEMWWGDRLLAVLCSPNVAFLLLILGFYGILFELYSPGWGVSGTLGAVLIVLGFFALAILPINYVGLLLIALALGMFVAEVFVTSFGALTLGGLVCLVLGGLMLVDSPAGFLKVSLGVIVPVAVATAAITLFLIGSIVRAYRGRVQTGADALIGAVAVSEDDFSKVEDKGEEDKYVGTVLTHGESWNAVSPTPVSAGQALQIQSRDGLTLRVVSQRNGPSAAAGTVTAPRSLE